MDYPQKPPNPYGVSGAIATAAQPALAQPAMYPGMPAAAPPASAYPAMPGPNFSPSMPPAHAPVGAQAYYPQYYPQPGAAGSPAYPPQQPQQPQPHYYPQPQPAVAGPSQPSEGQMANVPVAQAVGYAGPDGRPQQQPQQQQQAMSPTIIQVTVGSAVGGAMARPQLNADQAARAMRYGEVLRRLGVALLVLGCVGLVCSASYLSNILAIAAGAILVQTFSGAERVRTLLARGLSGVGDCCGHPMHALNLAIAIIVFAVISLIYSLNLVLNNRSYINSSAMQCNRSNCYPASTGGTRYLWASWLLGIFWSIAYICLATGVISVGRRFEDAAKIRFGACISAGGGNTFASGSVLAGGQGAMGGSNPVFVGGGGGGPQIQTVYVSQQPGAGYPAGQYAMYGPAGAIAIPQGGGQRAPQVMQAGGTTIIMA